jgi:Ca-activated chloride channel family protein
VVAVDIALEAPDEAPIGTTVQVELKAPDGLDGLVKLFAAGRKKSIAYGYARAGKQGGYRPVTIRLPAIPGEYVLRWLSGRKELLAERPITVVPADIKLLVPEEAPIASAIDVGFAAPAGLGGQVRLFVSGRKKYLSYGYVREGQLEDYQPTRMRLPVTPGDYLLRWISTEKEVLAEATVRVVAADLTIEAPNEVAAGEHFDVTISGPDGLAGRVHIIAAGTGKSLTLRSVQDGSITAYEPLSLKAPKQPGDYLIRWMTVKKEILAERSLTVTE